MRIVYFMPIVAEKESLLPTRKTVETALKTFGACSVVDAVDQFDIEDWTDFREQVRMSIHAFDAVLLVAPRLNPVDARDFFNQLRAFKAENKTLPIVGMCEAADITMKFNMQSAGVADVFRADEHMSSLAISLRNAYESAPAPAPAKVYKMGPLLVDFDKGQAYVNDNCVALQDVEYQLLAFLTAHKGKMFKSGVLMHELNKPTHNFDLIKTLISNLRGKLSATDADYPDLGDRLIRVAYGSGYYAVAKQNEFDSPLSTTQAGRRTAKEARLHAVNGGMGDSAPAEAMTPAQKPTRLVIVQ